MTALLWVVALCAVVVLPVAALCVYLFLRWLGERRRNARIAARNAWMRSGR